MNNRLAFIALVVAVIALGGYFAPNPATEVIREITERFGATPGNDIQGPVVKINGAPLIGLSQRFETGTTTVCSLDVRPYASSSIVSLGGTVQGLATTTGKHWKWYWGVGPKSTSTLIAGMAVTATGTSVMATTSIASDTAIASSGRNFLVLDFEGGSTPYFDINGQTGSCSAILHSPNAQ